MVNEDYNEKMEDLYFDFQAEIGITKHMGALAATNRLIKIARVDPQSVVLDIGCGVGFTPVHLLEQIGCSVYAVDQRESMITRSKKNAEQAGLLDQIDFRAADAVDLPFEDNMFDAIIIESVNAFIGEKETAFKEYYRVLKHGGMLVNNEATWKKTPPEHVRTYMDSFMNNGDILKAEEWESLFKKAGFRKVTVEISDVNLKEETSSRIKQFGWKRVLSAWGKTVKLYFSNPDYRRFLKTALGSTSGGIIPYIDYIGYGLYSGKKVK